jgi:hypothetical protein
MPLFLFVWDILAWSITVSLLGVVIFPWGILAYKIWYGNKPIDEEMKEELLWRSFVAGWSLAAAAAVFLVLDFMCGNLDLPAGPVHMVFYLAFMFLAAGIMKYCFSMEDVLQALILAVLYLYIPAGCLFFLRSWNPLYKYVLTWLLEPTA